MSSVEEKTAQQLSVPISLREVANVRVHATTGHIPLVRLEQEREWFALISQ